MTSSVISCNTSFIPRDMQCHVGATSTGISSPSITDITSPKMLKQMVTGPKNMFFKVYIQKIKSTFSERTSFWLIFGFVGPRQSLDFPRQSLGFPRHSLGFPRVDHAGTTHPSCVFVLFFPLCSKCVQFVTGRLAKSSFEYKPFSFRQHTKYELSQNTFLGEIVITKCNS